MTLFILAESLLILQISASFTVIIIILYERNLIVTYIDEKHQRVSSESAYLTPDVLSRKNLTVAINATVTRIIFEHVNGETHAVGVEFARKKDGERYRARARRDVVLW